ncbi:8384_t:CDS:1, partial [Racocetra fulgida]
ESVVGPINKASDTALREGHSEFVGPTRLVAGVSPSIPPHIPPNAPVLLEPVVMQKK